MKKLNTSETGRTMISGKQFCMIADTVDIQTASKREGFATILVSQGR
jgi:hypothetical protein